MKRIADELDSSAKHPRSEGHHIVWFRNDLRIDFNPALSEASKGFGGTIGLYIANPTDWKRHRTSVFQIDLIFRRLAVLKELLAGYNIPLLVISLSNELSYSFDTSRSLEYASSNPRCSDDILDVQSRRLEFARYLKDLCLDLKASALYFNDEYEWDEKKRDDNVESELRKARISVHRFHDQCLVEPGKLLTKSTNTFFKVFTPFKNAWLHYLEMHKSSLLQEKPVVAHSAAVSLPKIQNLMDFPISLDILSNVYSSFPSQETLDNVRQTWPADQASIEKKLMDFIAQPIKDYKINRELPYLDNGTSRLSAYYRLGALSVFYAINKLIEAFPRLLRPDGSGMAAYLSELCWRDFYRHLVYFAPGLSKGEPFQEATKNIAWRGDDEAKAQFEAWKNGMTGYPIVDAGMRQLRDSGWMHNRVRMIVASFLTKDLLVHWRWGEDHFSDNLIDCDLSSNNGGWQWSASTGTDPQPYFRIFHPHSQSQRYDPNGEYIKRWIPELRCISDPKAIHDPCKVLDPLAFQKLNYPKPLVDHAQARERFLNAFRGALKKA